MNRRVIFDPVTAELESFVHGNLDAIWTTTRAEADSLLSAPSAKSPQDQFLTIKKDNDALRARIAEICAQYGLFEFLLLVRKVPKSVLPFFLTGDPTISMPNQPVQRALFHDTVLFATNCALLHCGNTMQVKAINDRNHFRPSRNQMWDAVRLVILAGWHTYNTFYLNSLARASASENENFGLLLEIYNRRITGDGQGVIGDSKAPVVNLTAAIDDPALQHVEARWPNAPDSVRIALINYLPVFRDGDVMREAYQYLAHPDFEKLFRVSFSDFWRSWQVLNRLVIATIPDWSPGTVYRVDSSLRQMRLERFFDLCENGLGGGWLSDIKGKAFDRVSREFPDLVPSRQAYERCIELATWAGEMPEGPGFVEQPYLFYQVGPDAAYWDYMRHGGFVKALARRAVRTAGGIGSRKGEVFERLVFRELQTLSGGNYLKRNVMIGPIGSPLMEIDIALIQDRVLYLLEVKSHFKSPKYYAAEEEDVRDRTTRMIGFLFNRDAKIRECRDVLKQTFPDLCIGAISLVVTSEAEFLPSLAKEFWIRVQEVPRICTLTELKVLLAGIPAHIVEHHSAFVRF